MSAQVCPVCGGKGLVPNGFYDVSSTNLSNTRKTTSATPETCRSCGGKGYIIEYPDYYSSKLVFNPCRICSTCANSDENPRIFQTPNSEYYGVFKYECLLDGKLYSSNHSCKNYKRIQTFDK